MAKKFWKIGDYEGDTCCHNQQYETLEEAISAASDLAAGNDSTYHVLAVVAIVKPERAPVSVTTL